MSGIDGLGGALFNNVALDATMDLLDILLQVGVGEQGRKTWCFYGTVLQL